MTPSPLPCIIICFNTTLIPPTLPGLLGCLHFAWLCMIAVLFKTSIYTLLEEHQSHSDHHSWLLSLLDCYSQLDFLCKGGDLTCWRGDDHKAYKCMFACASVLGFSTGSLPPCLLFSCMRFLPFNAFHIQVSIYFSFHAHFSCIPRHFKWYSSAFLY